MTQDPDWYVKYCAYQHIIVIADLYQCFKSWRERYNLNPQKVTFVSVHSPGAIRGYGEDTVFVLLCFNNWRRKFPSELEENLQMYQSIFNSEVIQDSCTEDRLPVRLDWEQ